MTRHGRSGEDRSLPAVGSGVVGGQRASLPKCHRSPVGTRPAGRIRVSAHQCEASRPNGRVGPGQRWRNVRAVVSANVLVCDRWIQERNWSDACSCSLQPGRRTHELPLASRWYCHLMCRDDRRAAEAPDDNWSPSGLATCRYFAVTLRTAATCLAAARRSESGLQNLGRAFRFEPWIIDVLGSDHGRTGPRWNAHCLPRPEAGLHVKRCRGHGSRLGFVARPDNHGTAM